MKLIRFSTSVLAISLLAACGDDDTTPSDDASSVEDTSDATSGGDTTDTDSATNDGGTDTIDTTDTSTPDDIVPDDGVAVDTTPDDTSTPDADDATDDTTTPDAGDTTSDDATDADDTDAGESDCDPDATPFGGTEDAAGMTFNLVCSPVHLDNIRTEPTGNFLQTADIELTGTWTPIPEFQGSLVGSGDHVISGLSIESPDADTNNYAFIQFLTNGGSLQSLRFDDVVFTGHHGAPIVSIVRNQLETDLGKPQGITPVSVLDVAVRATINVSDGQVGGIFRAIQAGSLVEDVSFHGNILATDDFINGDANVGGISWRLSDARLNRAYVDAQITLPDHRYVAGMVVEATGEYEIDEAVVEGNVTGESYVGGLAATLNDEGTVTNARVSAPINANADAGGIAQACSGLIANSYTAIFTPNEGETLTVDALCYNFAEEAGVAGLAYSDTFSNGGTIVEPVTAVSDVDMRSGTAVSPFDTYNSDLWVFTAGNLPLLAFESDVYDWEE
jgi:hypothetical protein